MQRVFLRVFGKLNLSDRIMTPFLRVTEQVPRNRFFHDFLDPFLATGSAVTLQIMGTQKDVLGATAAQALELFPQLAGINLNFGCPSHQVTRHGAGGGALRNPAQSAAIVQAVRQAIPKSVPLSVKMRCAWEHDQDLEELVSRYCDAGANFLVVHYRTVRELYFPIANGLERLERAAAAAARFCVPVIGNGDIADVTSAQKMGQIANVIGIMAGRGFFRDPLLLRRIAQNDAAAFPPAPLAREHFFAEILAAAREMPLSDFSRGKAIELAVLTFGACHPIPEHLKKSTEVHPQWDRFFEPGNGVLPLETPDDFFRKKVGASTL